MLPEFILPLLPLLQAATETPVTLPGDDPLTAIGGVTGLIAGAVQAIKQIRRWDAGKAIALALLISLAVSTGITLAVYWQLAEVVVETLFRGIAYFVYTSGLYKFLQSSGVGDLFERDDRTR